MLAIADEEAPTLSPAKLADLRVDLVLGAGDLPWDYLEYVACGANAQLAFIPGNHDPAIAPVRLTGAGLWLRDGRPAPEPRPLGGINLDQQAIEVAGLRIAGLGGCVRYRPGPHQYDQREYDRRARRLARRARRLGGIDLLLTHAPPYGLGDADDAPHQGIQALHGLLAQLQPTWLLHGHIHPHGEQRPDRRSGETTIANVIPYRVLDITPRVAPKEAAHAQHRVTARRRRV